MNELLWREWIKANDTPFEFLGVDETDFDRVLLLFSSNGISGEDEISNCPVGWVGLLDMAALFLADVSHHRTVKLVSVSDKSGVLSVNVELRLDDEIDDSSPIYFLCKDVMSEITDRSARRCAMTGRPGKLREVGWHRTLSDDAEKLWGDDTFRFHEITYPLLHR